jgi:acyl transferase domain-containing protein/NAD(P)-dependent dehydrogenase (short-subunit alcohol dehydrogenase family)/acyl carrier protein/SAM-dependent methyltransferase
MTDSRLTEKQRTVLLLKQLQAKLDAKERQAREPIAVIGMGCRFPGGIRSPDDFWRLLTSATDAITEVPPTRWDIDAWYDPDPDLPGKMNTRWGGFLDDVDQFDAEFFGISPREATSMDPQQRLILEVAWEALEDANIPPPRLQGSRAGVFLGICTSDYARLEESVSACSALDTYAATGGACGVAAGRLSYTLGLRGPSLVVDTACSSSAMAVHLACQALRAGECDLALAGGVNLVLLPDGTVSLSRLRMMSPDGRCKPFDAAANGFVRGEGCGVLILKTLAAAQADDNKILAVIRGSAANQDGRSAGLTAPSGLAQESVLRDALTNSGLQSDEIDYVEAHGTGTELGDPIEMNALAKVMGADRQRPLWVGSVKSNLGHLEAAAGIAGLIKTIEILRHGKIPPTLHFQRLNPHIRLAGCPIQIPSSVRELAHAAPLRAGVSSFGFSGSNVHIVLESASPHPPTMSATTAIKPRGLEVLPLSAPNASALAALAARLCESKALDDYAAACFTLGAGRANFEHRQAIVAANGDEARAELLQPCSGHTAEQRPRIAFLFTGQGCQLPGMGRTFYDTEPVFRTTLDECAHQLQPLLERPLTELLFGDAADLNQTVYAQPCIVAYEIALAALWRSWGVEPDALLGHSLGEYAAAAVADAAPRAALLSLVARRGQLMQALPAGGAMLAVRTDTSRLTPWLAADTRLALAAENGPQLTTVSGPDAAITALAAELSAQGLAWQRLAVSHAFHSALLDPMLDDLEQAAAEVPWRTPGIPIVSNLTGKPIDQFNPGYWRRHSRHTVAFSAGVQQLKSLGCELFLEIGPQPIMIGMGRHCVTGGSWLASARKEGQDGRTLMTTLGRLFELGVPINWEAVHAGRPRHWISLPGYPFQRRRFWRDSAQRMPAAAPHPLLAERMDLPDGVSLFRGRLPRRDLDYINEHRIEGRPMVPAATWLEACIQAAIRCGLTPILGNIQFEAPLVLDMPREVQILIKGHHIEVHSRPLGLAPPWTRHLTAQCSADATPPPPIDTARCPEPIDPAALYAWLEQGGLDYGSRFRRITEAWRGEQVALARLLPAQTLPGLHPTLLDATLQTLAALTFAQGDGVMRIPAGIEAFWLDPHVLASVAAPADLRAQARVTGAGSTLQADLRLVDAEDHLLAWIRGLSFSLGAKADPWRNWLLQPIWRRRPLPVAPAAIINRLTAELPAATNAPELITLAGLAAALDQAALAYAARTLSKVPRDKVVPHQLALHDHLRQWPLESAHPDAERLLDECAVRYPQSHTEIALVRRCGARLTAVLDGRQDPLQLLFPAESSEQTDNIYRDAPVSRLLNRLLEDAVLATLPDEIGLRILEVGAGTGGTTDGLLARLPAARMLEYAFTDIAPGLIARAASRYATRKWLQARRLDLDLEPTPQGFSNGHYHLVLAANVIHATADLQESLSRLHRLLVPGGYLVMLEGAGRQGWIDLTFGLTAGWWRFTDKALRPNYPLLDRSGWRTALERCGFETAVLPVDPQGLLARQTIIVARARRLGAWWLIGDTDPLTLALERHLREAGEQVLRLTADAPLPQQRCAICVYTQPLAETAWPLADSADDEQLRRENDALWVGQRRMLEPLHRLALNLTGRAIPLAVVTRGARNDAPTQATVWGLSRAIAQELPELAPLRIDLDPKATTQTCVKFLTETLRFGDIEDQLACSANGEREVARLVRYAAPDHGLPALDANACYLITGGLGGLGLRSAQWLVERGARTLILLGRSAPSANAVAVIEQLRALGAELIVVSGDVSRVADLQAALAATPKRLAGVIHAAGVLDDGTLGQLSWARFAHVLAAKVAGAWWLHRLTGALDFFLLYSSAVGLVGSSGQANHVAANAFLDALAAHRRALGQPAVSLAWGAWRNIGAAANTPVLTRLRNSGMDVIAPEHGIRLLDWALGEAPACVGVLPIHWDRFAAALGDTVPPVLRELIAPVRTAPPDAATATAKQPEPLALKLPQAPSTAIAVSLIEMIRREAAAVLSLDEPSSLDPKRNLFDLGLDSLMAVELRNRLQRQLERPLPSTLLFNHPTPAALALFLGETPDNSAARPSPERVMRNEEPIAIIGMDCRFPGGADDPEQFWQRLCDGFDAVEQYPADRCNSQQAQPAACRWGAFLTDVDCFDAAFFHIAPREAAAMDPQQRLLLETVWHALERSGQAPDRLTGSSTGVFVGLCNYDYSQIAAANGRIDAWSGTGGAPSIVAGRLAYVLGLQGPALVVDTACSSSLVAVHLASRALIDGECDMAVAGGVNLILTPSSTLALSEMQMMAPDGRCKAFDASADGFVRGEGCGVVVLKRLSQALAQNDPILAVIRGSSMNQDGRSSSLTAPNGQAQEAVIRDALARAGVAPGQVDYIESHGTGTALGDPIEIHALKAVFGPGRSPDAPLWIGAVKSNIGHLEAAAGIAGLIKTVLALKAGQIPANRHFHTLNPHIALEEFPAALPVSVEHWPQHPGQARLAGVSSFGFSGTNVHLVVEAPATATPPPSPARREPQLLLVSGATPSAARTLADAYADLLAATEAPTLADLAYTLRSSRAQLNQRIAVVAADPAQAAAALRAATPQEIPAHPTGLDGASLAITPPPGSDPEIWLKHLAEQFLAGANIHHEMPPHDHPHRLVSAPVYPFERQRYWVSDGAAPRRKSQPPHLNGVSVHSLLGARQRGPASVQRFENRLDIEHIPWLADHRVGGEPVLPAAAMLEIVAATMPRNRSLTLQAVRFQTLLPLRPTPWILTQRQGEDLVLHATAEAADDWSQILQGRIDVAAMAAPVVSPTLATLRERCTHALPLDDFYPAFARQGLQYGTAFRTVVAVYQGDNESLVELRLGEDLDLSDMRLHPALLDGAFQSLAVVADPDSLPAARYLPIGLSRITWSALPAGRAVWAMPRLQRQGEGQLRGDIRLFTPDGRLLAEVEDLRLQDIQETPRRAYAYVPAWQPCEVARPPNLRHWHIGGDDRRSGNLASALRDRGLIPGSIEQAEGVVFFAGSDVNNGALLHLVHVTQTIQRLPRPPRLWVITAGVASLPDESPGTPEPNQGALWGFVLALTQEHPQWMPTIVDTDPENDGSTEDLLVALGHPGPVLAVRSGKTYRRHWVERQIEPGSNFCLRRPPDGQLGELFWIPTAVRRPGSDEVEIAVLASGLNFRDLMNALGVYPGEAGPLGGECSGIITAIGSGVTRFVIGQPVMAIAPGCHASHVIANAALTIPKPDSWSFQQAGALQTVFLTAAWALRRQGRIRAGQRVLIHAGSGGLGLAAIQIARTAGATVVATAGSAEKRAYLRHMGISGVSDSRSMAFVNELRSHTQGEGVDIVLNSLSGELIAGSFDLLRPGGCFLEAGKAGIWDQQQANTYRPDVDYQCVALDSIIAREPQTVGAFWQDLLGEFESGALQPLPVKAYPFTQAEAAYRLMQKAGHIGRVALSRFILAAEGAWLITGGSGALGLAVSRWLVARGARHLILAARHPADERVRSTLTQLSAWGARIELRQVDVSQRDAMERLFASCQEPISGIVHAAGILDDSVVANLTPARLASVMAPKLDGAIHLDALSRGQPLEHFILFSSASGALGSAGQSAYAAANAALDTLAWRRRAEGLPALVIDWGAWADGGMAGERDGASLDPDIALAAMEWLMHEKAIQSLVLPLALDTASIDKAESESLALSEEFAMMPAGARARSLLSLLVRQTAAILSLPETDIDPQRPLNDYGLDSLMALELRNALASMVGSPLPASLLFDYPTLDAVGDFLLPLLVPPSPAPSPAEQSASASPAPSSEAALSLDDATRALMDELDQAGY